MNGTALENGLKAARAEATTDRFGESAEHPCGAHRGGRSRVQLVDLANIAAYVVIRIVLVPLSGQASGEFQLSSAAANHRPAEQGKSYVSQDHGRGCGFFVDRTGAAIAAECPTPTVVKTLTGAPIFARTSLAKFWFADVDDNALYGMPLDAVVDAAGNLITGALDPNGCRPPLRGRSVTAAQIAGMVTQNMAIQGLNAALWHGDAVDHDHL